MVESVGHFAFRRRLTKHGPDSFLGAVAAANWQWHSAMPHYLPPMRKQNR
jgi:hypothetical protein